MKKQKIRIDKVQFARFVLVACAAAMLVCCLLTYYMIGVFERASTERILESRIEKVKTSLDGTLAEREAIMQLIETETLSKAKALSLSLIHVSFAHDFDYELIEETRLSLELTNFYITDENGIVVSGTDAYVGNNISELWPDYNFSDAIKDKTYSTVIRPQTRYSNEFIGAVSRVDADGVIIVTFNPQALEKTLELTDVSHVASEYPIFKNGTTSIIDIETYTYLSHTDSSHIDQRVQIPVIEFEGIDEEGSTGSFKIKLEGKKQYIYYEIYKDYILTANIPISEVYVRRNFATATLILVCPLVCLVILLAARTNLIKQKIWY